MTIKKYDLSRINDEILPSDLFICHSSFETRCLSVVKNVERSKFSHSIVFYTSGYEKEEINRHELKKLLGCDSKFVELGSLSTQADPMQPLRNADSIKDVLDQVKLEAQINSILVDITTFTHESLLVLLKLLKMVFGDVSVHCLYNNAESYDPANQTEKKWLSKGAHAVRTVLGYSGNISPIQKTHLVLIVGYEAERAARIVDMIEPMTLSLGYGEPNNALTEKNREANEYYVGLVQQMTSSYVDIPMFNVMCDDPYQTCQVLLDHSKQFEGRNIIIVPLNSKLSTLGVAFAAIQNPDIQVCYSPADTYNSEDYSKPGDKCYVLDITSELQI